MYIGASFIFGLVGEKDAVNAKELSQVLATEENKNPRVIVKNKVTYKVKKKKTVVKGMT